MKRGFQTSVTFGNAKAIDLLAHNPKTDHNFAVQVKALRTTNYFLISKDRIKESHVSVFVLLNKPGEAVRYFIEPKWDGWRAMCFLADGCKCPAFRTTHE